MSRRVEYLDLDDVVMLAERLLGTPAPIGDVGLLGSAVARPLTTIGGQDAYPDAWSKAAALIQSIVNNHALIDGNTRLGWLASSVFLDMNGVDASRISNDDVYEFVMTVASTAVGVDEIAHRLHEIVDSASD